MWRIIFHTNNLWLGDQKEKRDAFVRCIRNWQRSFSLWNFSCSGQRVCSVVYLNCSKCWWLFCWDGTRCTFCKCMVLLVAFLFSVGPISDKFTSSSHQLLFVCYDNNHTSIRYVAWSTCQIQDDACSSKCILTCLSSTFVVSMVKKVMFSLHCYVDVMWYHPRHACRWIMKVQMSYYIFWLSGLLTSWCCQELWTRLFAREAEE